MKGSSWAIRVTFGTIVLGVAGGEAQEIIRLSRAPCVIQVDLCLDQHEAQLHVAGEFASSS